jgi:hypothetical protein
MKELDSDTQYQSRSSTRDMYRRSYAGHITTTPEARERIDRQMCMMKRDSDSSGDENEDPNDCWWRLMTLEHAGLSHKPGMKRVLDKGRVNEGATDHTGHQKRARKDRVIAGCINVRKSAKREMRVKRLCSTSLPSPLHGLWLAAYRRIQRCYSNSHMMRSNTSFCASTQLTSRPRHSVGPATVFTTSDAKDSCCPCTRTQLSLARHVKESNGRSCN